MDMQSVFKKAGGKGQVARICGVTWQSVSRWEKANKLPFTEWTGETDFARKISLQAELLQHHVVPSDVCPGAGQYMAQQDEKSL